MRPGGRGTYAYVVAAMLTAAVSGRLLDVLALLPGVHEAQQVRGGTAAWFVAVAAAAVVGAGTAARWRATRSLRAVTAVVVPGQTVVFFAAEAAVRIASGQGPVDPDGVFGALLQAGIALVLLLALTCAWVVGRRCLPLGASAPSTPADRRRRGGRAGFRCVRLLQLVARAPPAAVAT